MVNKTKNLYEDGRIPYFYIIRHKHSKKLYAGCRYGKNCHPDELLVSYFTSSTKIKRIIESEQKMNFEIIRIDTNCDGLHPHDYETLFLEVIDAARNESWINSHNNTVGYVLQKDDVTMKEVLRQNGLKQGKKNAQSGHMKEIQKLSDTKKAGQTAALKNKLNNAGSFYNKEEHKKAAIKGGQKQGKINATDGHLKNISNNYWDKVKSGEIIHHKRFFIHNPDTKENKSLIFGSEIPDGWVKGRCPTKQR